MTYHLSSGPLSLRSPALLLALLLLPSVPLRAAINEALPDEQTLSQLELRAQQANPREQCFLYTELVHTVTELAGKQMLAGEIDHASASLKRVEHYAQLIHLGLADDTKRLKNAELLMHHTTHRLSDYMRAASIDDRETLQATLKQLNVIQDELLNQVFKH
ncbi:MAG: hypothetical protein NVSMB3_04850 [Acidobacteriaceae bacterium]